MELREDPLESVIEEIAALLATGYLRLRKARILAEPATPPVPAATGERPDSVQAPALMVFAVTPREKGD